MKFLEFANRHYYNKNLFLRFCVFIAMQIVNIETRWIEKIVEKEHLNTSGAEEGLKKIFERIRQLEKEGRS